MIRVLFGSALPVLGLGAAAALLSPNLLSAPRGEPLIVAAPAEATLQPATFDGEACASALLFADSAGDGQKDALAGARIIAFALRSDDNDVAVAIEFLPGGNGKAKAVVLVFDDEGHLTAAGDPTSLQVPFDNEIAHDCPPEVAAPI